MKTYYSLEKKVFEWIKKNRHKIYLFVFLLVLLWAIPKVPYANVVLTYKLSILLMMLIFFYLFKISFKKVLFIVFGLFLLCLVFQLVGQLERADILGDYIFGILFIQVLGYIFKPYEKKKK